jgi:hypothetical protein
MCRKARVLSDVVETLTHGIFMFIRGDYLLHQPLLVEMRYWMCMTYLLQYADLAQPEMRALCELVGSLNV